MKIYNYIKLVVFLTFSVLIFFYTQELVENLKYLIPALLGTYGLESIILYAIKTKRNCFKYTKFIYGFAEVTLALTILFGVTDFESICAIWAVWAIIREFFEVQEVTTGKAKGIIAFLIIAESIVSIGFSIALLINSTEHHAKTHVYLLVAELVLNASVPILESIVANFQNRKRLSNNT